MSVDQLLQFSRVFGVENLSQAKRFARAVQSGTTGVSRMHLELTPEMCDEFVHVSEQVAAGAKLNNPNAAKSVALFKDSLGQIMDIAKKYFPQTYAKGSKAAIDVELNRLGAKSGTVKFSEVTKTADGKVVGEGKGVIAKNAGGMKCNVSAKVEGYGGNYDATILSNIEPEVAKVLPKIQYKAENGIAEMSIPRVKGKGYEVQANCRVPEEYVDQETRILTSGEINSFGELLDKARTML